ncbi:UNVERIFIED_CONTAM: hypothetical protein ITH36_25215, partial [Salmonella enterica subsp. enterica serovar Weltevreden]
MLSVLSNNGLNQSSSSIINYDDVQIAAGHQIDFSDGKQNEIFADDLRAIPGDAVFNKDNGMEFSSSSSSETNNKRLKSSIGYDV